MNYLPSSIEYWGYDISPEYIAAARARYGARGHFHCGFLNPAEMSKLPKFDRVLATGVLHHLNDDEAEGFFALAEQALKTSGRVVSIDPCLAPRQNPLARFLIMKDRGENVRDAQGYLSLAKDSFLNVTGTLRHRAWIPYTHWVMECTK